MENLVTYEFICINDLEKSFKLNIKKSQEDFNNLNWLLNLAEITEKHFKTLCRNMKFDTIYFMHRILYSYKNTAETSQKKLILPKHQHCCSYNRNTLSVSAQSPQQH